MEPDVRTVQIWDYEVTYFRNGELFDYEIEIMDVKIDGKDAKFSVAEWRDLLEEIENEDARICVRIYG